MQTYLRAMYLIAEFAAKQIVAWVSVTLLVLAATLAKIEMVYQMPPLSADSVMALAIAAAGCFINVGILLNSFRYQRLSNERYDKMREEWIRYQGLMEGRKEGRQEVLMELKEIMAEKEQRERR